jgi:short-subunit dehydrogenase
VNLVAKRIVVTGGTSGIGKALSSELLRRGNSVTIVSDHPASVERAVDELREISPDVRGFTVDLANRRAIDAFAAGVLDDGAPDVLVNNAGFGVYRTFERSDIDEIARLIDVNLSGHVLLTKALLAPMIERRSGAIAFMASIAGRLPITPNATYCAAKHGMMGLATALRYELRRFGITVSAICPGRVETPFFAHETFASRTRGPEMRSSVPIERVVSATISAIEAGKAVTYMPRNLGVLAWALNAVPFLAEPVFSRVTHQRIERLYADLTN